MTTKFFTPVNLGKICLCFVFSIRLLHASIIAGSTVITQITPISTPFAITNPISFPSVRFILHKAKNPAIVVNELPTTDSNVFLMAFAIALLMSVIFSFSCI